jgi:hypothetical protein
MAEKQHPKIELPAQEELRRLSKYAQVAYAARRDLSAKRRI